MSDMSSKAKCQIDLQCFLKTFLHSVYQQCPFTDMEHRKQYCQDLIQNSRLWSSLNIKHLQECSWNSKSPRNMLHLFSLIYVLFNFARFVERVLGFVY